MCLENNKIYSCRQLATNVIAHIPGIWTSASIVTTMQQLGLNSLDSYTIFDVSGRETDRADLAPGTYFIKTDDVIMHKVVLVK